MKILFYTQVSPSKELGGSKVAVEIAEEMEILGWNCTVMGPEEVRAALPDVRSDVPTHECLRQYLHQHASKYDVVDYDHFYLPYPRSEFSSQTLLVARSVLLAHHFERIPIPQRQGIKSAVRRLLFGKLDETTRRESLQRAYTTIQQADLVNVSNNDDWEELIRCGISEEKVVVLPFGMSALRRQQFDTISAMPPKSPVVGFVGTFDYRKGAHEFPAVLQQIVTGIPDVRFLLLGTAGLYQTKQEVLAHFPKHLATRIEVIPRFPPEQLPELLSACSVGIFPSYIEGFGFGVLEMLSAAVPVVAYNSPGPPMMLSAEYLVPRGDVQALSNKIIALLSDSTKLKIARTEAQRSVQHFSWQNIARETNYIYSKRLRKTRDSLCAIPI